MNLPEGFTLEEQQEQPKQEMSLPEGFTLEETPQEQPKQEHTTDYVYSSTPKFIVRNIIDPLVEVDRGFARGASSLYNKADAATKLTGKMTKITPDIFGEWAKQATARAESLPETGIDPVSKFLFGMAGQAIPIATEFAAVKMPAALASFKGLADVGKFAVLEALNEYGKTEKPESLVVGGARGAATGAGMQVAGRIFKMVHGQTKKTVKTWLTALTGNKKAAKALAENPKQFNLNPRGDVKSAADIIEENKLAEKTMKENIGAGRSTLKATQQSRKELLNMKIADAKSKLDMTHTNAKNSLTDRQGATLNELIKQTDDAVEASNRTLQEQTVALYDDTLANYTAIRKDAGKAVENAVNATVNTNPGVPQIPFKTVSGRMQKTLSEKSPFKIKKDKVIGRTAVPPNPNDAKIYKNMVDDVNSRQAEGGFNVRYLQDLKEDLNNLAGKYFKSGDTQLGKMYSELSKDVNPATIVSESKALTSKLKHMAKANAEFANMIPKYKKAMSHYFKEDITGEFIPNPSKATNAIAKNNLAVIRDMKKADMALPAGDRIYPKMKSLMDNSASYANKQKALVSGMKHRAKLEKRALESAQITAKDNLRKEGMKLSSEHRIAAGKEIAAYNDAKALEYSDVIKKFSDMETFYKQQDLLRQFRPSASTAARTIQNVAAMGSLTGFKYGAGAGLGGLAVTGATSPVVASNIGKASLGITGGLDKALSPALTNPYLQKLVGSQILNK